MSVRRVHPLPGNPIELDAADARQQLAALYERPEPGWLRVNLIASVSGSAAGSDGTSDSLSNRADRMILGVIRRSSDVVLVGAVSIRTEGYLLPRTVPLAIVTGTGNLAGHRLGVPAEIGAGVGRIIVLCPQSAVATVHATLGNDVAEIVVLADTDGRLNIIDLVGALRERNLARIVCEGGPELAGSLLNENLVDELCLSTSAQLGGTTLALFGNAHVDEKRLALDQLLIDTAGTLYARWTPERRLPPR